MLRAPNPLSERKVMNDETHKPTTPPAPAATPAPTATTETKPADQKPVAPVVNK